MFTPDSADAAIIGCSPLADRLESGKLRENDLQDAANRLRLFSTAHRLNSMLVEHTLHGVEMYKQFAKEDAGEA